VAPHLCGFSTDVARCRLLLNLKAYIDESGKSDPPVFVMAGFIARAEQWAAFNDEWREILDMPPRIEAFHAADSAWSKDRKRFIALMSVIRRHVMTGIAVTVFHDDYQAALGRRISARMDRPYFLMYQAIMALAFQWEVENGLNEKIDFIFDEQFEESDFLQSKFSELISVAPPGVKERFGNRPIHADDKKILSLQAADILAWSLRRLGQSAVEGRPADVVLTKFINSIPFRRVHWDRDRLSQHLEALRSNNYKRGAVTLHEADMIGRNIDAFISLFNKKCIDDAPPKTTIALLSIPARQSKRFVLVYKCPVCDSPHLHRRVGDGCTI
jgi:Protein of unknown function (DUF3800)